LDRESGFYFYNARHYDSVVGRFVSADTVIDGEFDSQGWNRFSYVHNNPVVYKDPTGHTKRFRNRVNDDIARKSGVRINPNGEPSLDARVSLDSVANTSKGLHKYHFPGDKAFKGNLKSSNIKASRKQSFKKTII